MDKQPLKKILIVDDDKAFVAALSTFLAGHGYQPLAANDAIFAIRHVTQDNIALMILDLGLPCGGGFSVLDNLRKIRGNTQLPIIISTANISPGIEPKSIEMGATDFIAKPYDLEALLEMINVRLNAS